MVRPDPGPAHDWLSRELARGDYRQSLLQRLGGWLQDLLDSLLGRAGSSGIPVPLALLVGVLLVGLAVLVAVVVRREPARRRGRVDAPGAVGAIVDSRAHRERAEAALAAGDAATAVVEAFRCLTRGLVERAVLEDDPGTTAREVAGGAGEVFGEQAGRLAAAADRFDAVQYGGRPASAADAHQLLALVAEVAGARPAPPTERSREAVPR